MKTTVGEIISYLHSIAPNEYQESYDNSGLIVGNMFEQVKGVIISLDCTEEVIQEAIDKGANMVISHHPIVFRGLKRFTGSDYVERTIMLAIKNNINIFAIHTNLDNMRLSGVNTKICERLKLTNTQILAPKDENGQIGAGMIGELPSPMESKEFLSFLKNNMELNIIKYTKPLQKKVHKIAVCGGSGSFLLKSAIAYNADVFITSDFKYHEYFDANNLIMIADIGHYESERFTIDLLYDLISNKFSTFAAHNTKINTNPIKYF